MFSIPPTQPNDDPIDLLLFDIASDSEKEIDSAWKTCCEEHIRPSRIVEISLEGAKASRDEVLHLQLCDSCRTHYEDYLEQKKQLASATRSYPVQNGAERSQASDFSENDQSTNGETSTRGFANDSIPASVVSAFLVDAPILFPGGEVARRSWQFGLIASLRKAGSMLAEEATKTCCDELLAAIRNRLNIDLQNVMFVCFGEAMHTCGVELAARLFDAVSVAPHVVLAHDYYAPKLVCDSREFENTDVVVLVDVVHSGSLLRRLIKLCLDYGPSTVKGLALIGQSEFVKDEVDYAAIWQSESEAREPLDEFRSTASDADLGRLRIFDPNRSCALQPYSDRLVDCDTSSASFEYIDPQLQECIERTDAMKCDFQIGSKKYAFAVNVLDLLRKDEESRKFIIGRAYSMLADCAFRNTCLAFHAGRSARAGVIAKALSDVSGWPSMAIGTRGKTFTLTDQQCRRFASFDNIVIVDAAIRTGDTIAAIAQAIAQQKVMEEPRVVGFCVLNSLTDIELEALSSKLDIELRSAFRLPLAPPSDEIRHWTSQQKAAIGKELIDQCASELIRKVLSEYCTPAFRKVFGKATQSSDEVALLINKAISHARKTSSAADQISVACSTRSPSAIRHLQVDDVINDRTVQTMLNGIMFNSMKPQFKESAAIALAAAGRYDWMTLKWLKVNEAFLESRGSAWKSIVMIEQLMSKDGRQHELRVFKEAAIEYRDIREAEVAKRKPMFTQSSLFSDLNEGTGSIETKDVVSERLDAFIEAAQV